MQLQQPQRGVSVASLFQSSSGQKAGCNPVRAGAPETACGFQSSSGQKAGCNCLAQYLVAHPVRFQSSSGQKAGCNRASAIIECSDEGFNPHPARRPDATEWGKYSSMCLRFQSSSGQKAGCNRHQVYDVVGGADVSILIRPEGRMQHAHIFRRWLAIGSFNPHPARRPDATRFRLVYPNGQACFNPHPARRPDATNFVFWDDEASLGFNPHPARRPDATTVPPRLSQWAGLFQSSSGQKAGCNGCFSGWAASQLLFQSSSGQKAGCNRVSQFDYRNPDVQVSILIRPEGRMQHHNPPSAGVHCLFQSSSGQKAGCNKAEEAKAGRFTTFQSSSGQKAGCNGLWTVPVSPQHRSFNPHPARRPDATPVSEFPICSARTS